MSEYWDPVGKSSYANTRVEVSKLEERYDKYKQNPGRVRQIRNWLYVGAGVITVLLFLVGFRDFRIIIFLFAGGFVFSMVQKSFAKDLIKLMVAKDLGWLYDPSSDARRWSQYAKVYPEIFHKGDRRQSLEDQFWGWSKSGKDMTWFTTGLFHYTTGYGKHSTSHTEHFFAFYLNNKVSARFHLYPENAFSKLGNFFSKKEINTESVEFNKTFAFQYDGKKGEHALNIVRTLSPAVQLKLLDLKKANGSVEILFSGNVAIFLFPGVFMNKLQSDFMKSPHLHPDDKKFVTEKINNLISLARDLSKYIR